MPERVGFIGLGLMGLPMSRNLLRAGFDLTVYNRTPEKTRLLAAEGANVAATPAELGEQCDIVLACLGAIEASEETWLGRAGLVAHARSGQLFVDMSTIGPDTARRFADAARSRSAEFIDAPVSGGPEGAAAATLAIMAGGTETAFKRAEPLFGAMGKHVFHLGDVGAGSVAKLVNQLLTLVHGAVAAEAVGFGVRAGADPEQLLAVLKNSFGQSRMLERAVPRIVARNFAAGAPLRLYAKDLRLMQEMANGSGAPVPLLDTAGEALHQALRRGLGDCDITAFYRLYEREETGNQPGPN